MKRIRIVLLTLVLSIAMLAPEFSMLPAVYAEDETPAAELEQEEAVVDDAGEVTADDPAEEDAADPTAGEEPAVPDDPDTPADDSGSYDQFRMIDLDDAKKVVIPEEMQERIAVSHTEYGKGLLFTGTVADLNSTYITLDQEFNFDDGSVGRLVFDGLKDKDAGMSVNVEVYIDDCKSPIVSIPLKKQMGKKEWLNDGEKSVTLGEHGLSGKHRVALLLKITGKGDKKETSVMLRSFRFCKTTVPVMYFNIDESEGTIEAMNNSEDHSVECYGSVDLVVPAEFNDCETFRDEYSTQESLYGLDLEYIRGRGNSTWMDDKKPYKVKFDKKQDLFGFGGNAHWVLLANRYDNSLIRNRMTYWLGQQLGMEYTPQCVPVEVVMNGKFYGSYLLAEQIRVGKGRVEIDDLDDATLPVADEIIETGGYLLSMDTEEDEKRAFTTKEKMDFFIESPDDKVEYFSDYIKAYTQMVENAIFSDDFRDENGNLYTDYLDLDAAVDYWWIQEFSMNGDAYGGGSTYIYKKRDSDTDTKGKLYWGPLWDFDYVAWGDLAYDYEPNETLDYTGAAWFDAMKSDPVFIAKVKERWTEPGGLREQIGKITEKGGLLDAYLAQMETTYKYDHELWGPFESKFTNYVDEIEQLRSWINKRYAYVDEAVNELSTEARHITFTVDGKVIKEVDVIGALREKDFPDDPEKAGFVFSSWVDEDGLDYEEGSRVTQDMVLTAFFMEASEIVQAEEIFFPGYEYYYAADLDPDNSEEISYFYVDCKVMPEGAYDTDIIWTSSDESIAEMDMFGAVLIKNYGDVTITATLSNGVSKSFVLHVVREEDINECESFSLDKETMTLKEGTYGQILVNAEPAPCEIPDFMWLSSDETVATVDNIGVVTAVAPGTTTILAVNFNTYEILRCKVTVPSSSLKPADKTGTTLKRNGSTYKITSDKAGSRTAMLVKAKSAKSVTVPAYIKLSGQKYYVTKIKSKAFAKSKATKVTIKTKKLTKARVKGSLKGSKVKNVKVSVGKKKLNKKYVKKYKKYFTKKNCGRKVKVY